jgi:branched-chain amino acid transport system permease protein
MKRYIPLSLLLLVALFMPMFISNQYHLHTVIMILLYAYLATSWNIVGGFAGQLSLGHAAFMAIGGYTSTILFSQMGISPWIGMIVGGLIAAFIAVLIGLPTFRLKGAYYAISTIAFATGLMLILSTVKNIGPIKIGGAEGLSITLLSETTFFDFQFLSKVPYYYIILVFCAVILFVSWYVERSKLGFYLTAIREDEEAAKALGINVIKSKLIAAGLSAFFTALGGSFYAQLFRYLEPHHIAGMDFSIQMVFLAIVGGIGTVYGPFVGGILLTAVAEFTRVNFTDLPPGTHLVIYGVAVLLVILYFPKGIITPLQDLYKRIFARKQSVER